MRCRLEIAFIIVASAFAHAGPFPAPFEQTVRIPDLVAKSSLVCKGEVTAAPPVKNIDGPLPRLTGVASVRVDRCFKGHPSGPELLVAADEYLPAGGWVGGGRIFTPSVGEYLLLFLKPHGQIFEVADANGGALSVSRQVSTAPIQKDPLANLEADLDAGLRDPDPELVLRSICWLGRMQRLRSTRALRALLPDAAPVKKAYLWETLLLVGDLAVLKEVANALDENPPLQHDFVMPRDRLPAMQLRVYAALCSVRDPMVVPYLEHFAEFPDARVRVEAIQALRAMKNLGSAPVFLRALDDHREDIDFIAMHSLFELAGQGPSDFGPAYVDSADEPHPRVHPEQCRNWWRDTGEAMARARTGIASQ